MADDEAEFNDPRFAWMSDRVLAFMKQKIDKWRKLTGAKEVREKMLSFLEVADDMFLVFFMARDKDELCADKDYPGAMKRKSLVFLKKKPGQVNMDNINEMLNIEELASAPLDQLSAMIDDVYLPLLASGQNSRKWPRVVAQDVAKQFLKFQGSLSLFVGQTKGNTVLPLPPVEDPASSEESSQRQSIVHQLESAVVEWSHQIKKVIETEPEPLLSAAEANGNYLGPMSELEFWAAKSGNLRNLKIQLSDPKVITMFRILEKVRSSYVRGFKKMLEELDTALEEADDIHTHLQPLKSYLQDLSSGDDFQSLPKVFRPMFHIISLVWLHSHYYNTPVRIVVLLREMCNDIIHQAAEFINPGSIWSQEPPEALEKLQNALDVCGAFKSAFFEYKAKVNAKNPARQWRFENMNVFARIDLFMERIQDLMTLIRNFLEYTKLEKVEIGGGKVLSSMVESVFKEFLGVQAVISAIQYDIFDLKSDLFDRDVVRFQTHSKDFDRRLCYVIDKAFEQCATADAGFKLLESFETQMGREPIRTEIESKFIRLLRLYAADLDIVAELFHTNKESPPILNNLPRVAGTLSWCRGLMSRITWPMEKLQTLAKPLLSSVEGLPVVTKYEQVMQMLRAFQDLVYEGWNREVEDVSLDKLNECLLRRSGNMIIVNFDTALSATIQEAKYLTVLKMSVPGSANKIYVHKERYRQYVGNLQMIATQYNSIVEMLIDVERPLIRERLDKINVMIDRAASELTWKQEDLSDFIDQLRVQVKNLYNRLISLKGSLKSIDKILLGWMDVAKIVLREEKHDRREAPHPLVVKIANYWRSIAQKRPNDSPQDALVRRMAQRWRAKTATKIFSSWEINRQAERIHQVVSSCCEKLESSPTSPYWAAYVGYINDQVGRQLYRIVRHSLQYLVKSFESIRSINDYSQCTLNKKDDGSSFFEIKFELRAKDPLFIPEIDNKDRSMQGMIRHWVSCIYAVCQRITRVDRPASSSEDYSYVVRDVQELTDLKTQCTTLTDLTVDRVLKTLRSAYSKYATIFVEEPEEYLKRFHTGEVLGNKAPLRDGDPEDMVRYIPPKLEDYEAAIVRFEKLHDEITALPSSVSLGWLRIECQPIRQALRTVCQRWRHIFLEFLQNKITTSLTDLDQLIAVSEKGLRQDIKPGDYNKLVEMMGYLLSVRQKSDATEVMFEPLKETVAVLKKFNITVAADVLQALDDAPVRWGNLKKLCFAAKDTLAPLQNDEVATIRKMDEDFTARVDDLRNRFLVEAPFRFDVGVTAAYASMDKFHLELCKFEAECITLNSKQNLFELTVNTGKSIRDCRIDLRLLKGVWDVVDMVSRQLTEWKKIPFNKCNTTAIEDELKSFVKEMRLVDKRARGWDAFTGLDGNVKNFLTSLPLVQELRSPSMRPRHWESLMKTTNVSFELNDHFNLENLLALNLHKFVDDVGAIVDRAAKELMMEKSLAELGRNWANLCYEFDKHKDTPVFIIKVTEEVIETLEDNQVQLQNMSTSKYIAIFADEVSTWQKKLSIVDSVTSLITEVQRTWAYLENIFIGSEDIRAQLPEDSRRFEAVDAKLKEILAEMKKTPKIIEACTKSGLETALSSLQEQLNMCEKALAEYLETKRKAFPRFYFVSVPDLLDILSKGGAAPQDVMFHMPKLFQAVQKLEFATDENGKPTSTAIGMYAREGEYVKFDKPCSCAGQVEVWLERVVQTMRSSLRTLLGESIVTYEEKARDMWLFDYCAQIVLVASQIWWTSEVNITFDALEEGNENAMKDYNKKQSDQLTRLIQLVQGKLSGDDRQKIMCMITIDVHSRDVVANMIRDKVESSAEFGWQCQLRQRWDEKQQDCFTNICDAQFRYGYEYLGNGPRLVITPLTDRVYITLTQSLHLIMGGAPAGPAGTGKTETTKDLGSQLGKPVYVFNCSDQMDYKSLGDIFKGLASSGAWGCFDEFNRIAVEVLSVVSTQFKSILDAIREKKKRFNFQGEEISLDPTCGSFITMNPGYLGRTELPESLKALFRPVTVVVPDLELICENMLMAEGFINARVLAKKFITLYALNKDLLSKVDHYDWGLRAIKSVLVVAGALKRAEPDVSEDQILMRALRDFNLPKIVTDDLDVFLGLINDLFPGINPLRKRDMDFEKLVKDVVVDSGWQPEDSLILKVVQLEELLAVRHSVFIIGPSGAGKSVVWKSLAKSWTKSGKKTLVRDLNPKAITSNELYGYIHPATREWKDGQLSCIMRDLGALQDTNPKWIILDGDLDTEWIESMNSVMDDNKILTLASNERIPLLPHMRLIFEISHLKYATPATVSRAGILYIAETDIGWLPYVQSWIDKRQDSGERNNLQVLFDRYSTQTLNYVRRNFRHLIPISDFNMIQTLCTLLDGLYTPQNVPAKDTEASTYEMYFVFACVWAFGGALSVKDNVDYRLAFSKWWRSEWKAVKFPEQGTVFDYFINGESHKFERWSEKLPTFNFDPDVPMSTITVPTIETVCNSYFLSMFVDLRRPIMFVGNAGCGKTKLVQEKLNNLSEEQMFVAINFNYYTDALTLQRIMEQPLEKKAGRNFGPPGARRLIYYIDDMNMPYVDKYGTQSPIALLTQLIDYSHWYDRQKLTLKEIHNVQYVASMNPTSGSFTINPRCQRHFATFAIPFPGKESLSTIYGSILNGHCKAFGKEIQRLSEKIIPAALELHDKISSTFLKTAIKFHYEFNLRHLSNVFQGLLQSRPNAFGSDTIKFMRLWLHESMRVYGDRLVDAEDIAQFRDVLNASVKKNFPDQAEALMQIPNIFSHFAGGLAGERVYNAVNDFATLKTILEEALAEHNESNAAMNLVLFEDAMAHICRIARITQAPQGNALLVGVGGSGKQSLARLSAFINTQSVFQITISKTYGVTELKEDLKKMYMRSGVKNDGICFLFTDSQIVDERFLVYINDLLSSGNIPDLFAPEEKDDIINQVRNAVKQAGIIDTRENCWDYFINQVRTNLHVVLCFSPVGDAFRVRARKFPGLINCCSIDWFQAWPKEALLSVANRFLADVDFGSSEVHANVVEFMAFAHEAVNEASAQFKESERRYNYTTPKSFLELIKLYKNMLSSKRTNVQKMIDRLETGLIKLQSTSHDVAELEEKLKIQQVVVEEKKRQVNELLVSLTKDQQAAAEEDAKAQEEAAKCDVIARDVTQKQNDCAIELSRAEPAIMAAENALNTLNKNNLTELKSFKTPSKDVADVLAAVLILLAPTSKDRSWSAAQKAMAKVDAFLVQLQTYDKDNIPAISLSAVQPYITDPDFNGTFIKSKSAAAAGICEWVRNVCAYYTIYCEVKPKRDMLAEANGQLEEAMTKLTAVKAQVEAVKAKLRQLQENFEQANTEKMNVITQAEKTQSRLDLAQRLVRALASENVRWAEGIKRLQRQGEVLIGDVLLASAFVSYIGGFNYVYRNQLVRERWTPFLKEKKIPMSEDADPLQMLADDAEIAGWNNQGLPSDRVSVENGAILTSCERWPLIIDPQQQGIFWIKNRFSNQNLNVVRLGHKKILDIMEKAISNGEVVLIENIGESIDAVLGPILGRNTIKKGRSQFIRIGDKEVEYDKNFRLLLQTKLSNPHYKPEIQAETTLINFTVTEAGLEDQLLALVVKKERPDLEEQKAELIRQQNEFKITLKNLEDSLLNRLSNAQGDILGDVALIENLEETKKTSLEIEEKVKLAKETEISINKAREAYRVVAKRGSILYFLLNDLNKVEPMYQYSLNAFVVVFNRAIDQCTPADELKERIENLIDSITFSVFNYTRRGLFERHKLIFASQLCFKILERDNKINLEELDYLIRGRKAAAAPPNPLVDWLPDTSWAAVHALKELEEFTKIADDIEGSAKRWKEWTDTEVPEKEKLPQDWKNKSSFQRLLIIRALRPDRLTQAVSNFVSENMGQKYVDQLPFSLEATYRESNPATPLLFILFPGADPVKDVEALGKKFGFTEENNKFFNVSMGQGQEPIAERYMDQAYKSGGWVMLQNVHLMEKWLGTLERKLEQMSEGSNKDLRVFLTAEPSGDANKQIPQGILQTSIKIANEPPQTLKANLRRAYANFNQDTLESCMKQNEFKTILFSLCFFHAQVLGRRKFGYQGWSRSYSFNVGDLTISANVLFNYLESSTNVPWPDIRYIFGEIMYGGHITDRFDRRTCSTYLDCIMIPELLEGIDLAPGFPTPPLANYNDYVKYIDEALPAESPVLFGLHPNAEIGFLTNEAEALFKSIIDLRGGGGGGGGQTRDSKVKAVLDDILEKLPNNFEMHEIIARVEDKTPYVCVVLQETERMNILLSEIRRSLRELELGLRGELTISEQMDALLNSLFNDQVPASWEKVAYPSLKPLGLWFTNMLQRVRSLEEWAADLSLPKTVWLSGLFNPMSFLTAVMQTTARKNDWPLDKMCLQTEVTKRFPDEVTAAPRDGAYIHGLFIQGARWDMQAGVLRDSFLKELFPALPVMHVRSVTVDKRETKGVYECPVYITSMRGATFVFCANLKTAEKPAKWTLAGVAALLAAD